MGAVLRGRATRDDYVRLLAALHAIYSALEHALTSHVTHPLLGPLTAPAFARRATLEFDLVATLGADWRALAPTHPLAYDYAEHLHRTSRNAPERLLAHAWLRYLGDLNGGQVLARLVRGAPATARMATSFYEFRGLVDPRAAAGEWRARLDTLPLPDEVQQAIITEACDGFRRHIALFAALGSASAQDDTTSSRSEA